MNNNKKYFMEELGLKHDVFQPRPEAVAYKSQQDAEKAVLSFIEREFAQLEDSKEKVFILLHKYFSLETLRKRHELLPKAMFLFHKYFSLNFRGVKVCQSMKNSKSNFCLLCYNERCVFT